MHLRRDQIYLIKRFTSTQLILLTDLICHLIIPHMGPDLGPEQHISQTSHTQIIRPKKDASQSCIFPHTWDTEAQIKHLRGLPPTGFLLALQIALSLLGHLAVLVMAAWKRAIHCLRFVTSPLFWAFSSTKR